MGWLILAIVFGVTTYFWVMVNRDKGGPSHCMGCGKCDKDGVCVLKKGMNEERVKK
ncbi:hypothetical protein RFF05_02365 [Bengtsoniella intestinalis]|uniref:hypothetical protein n=1 Tax=Bengtsoniella intestinalis TaxID=3073143 RepID=UPI00391F5FF1